MCGKALAVGKRCDSVVGPVDIGAAINKVDRVWHGDHREKVSESRFKSCLLKLIFR